MNEAALQAFENFRPRPIDAWAFENDARRNFIRSQIANFPAAVFPNLESPTVICGIVHANGIGENWMLTGEGFVRSSPIVLQQQQALIGLMYRTLKLRRLCMGIQSTRDDAKLWAERLGYQYETTLREGCHRGGDLDIFLWTDNNEGENEHD